MEIFIGGKMSDSSKRLYLHNLKKLNDGKELKDFSYLKKTDDVMKKMPSNRNTARSYIIACVNATKGRKGFKKALEFYTKLMDDINKLLKDERTRLNAILKMNFHGKKSWTLEISCPKIHLNMLSWHFILSRLRDATLITS